MVKPERPRTWLVWLCPAAVTLLIAGPGVASTQPWRDELATWSAARRSIPEIVRMVPHVDAVSTPYYLFLHGWIALVGDSVPALRAPSLAAMVVAAGLTAHLGRYLFGPWAGVSAGLLVAVQPSTARYAQEARPYAAATALAVLATYLLACCLTHRWTADHSGGNAGPGPPAGRPAGWGRWAAYGLAVFALGFAHLVAVLLVAGHAVAALLTWLRDRDGRSALRWLAVTGAACLALLPLALLGGAEHDRQLNWVPMPHLGDLFRAPGSVFRSAITAGFVVGLAALGWALRGRWGWVLGLCVLLPTLLLFAAGSVVPLWVTRYLTFVVPLACLLAGAALALARPPAALAIVLLCLALAVPDQRAVRRSHDPDQIDYAGAAAIVRANARPGDAIAYGPRDGGRFLDAGMAYHLRGHLPRDPLVRSSALQRHSLWAEECPDPAACLAGTGRLWVVALPRGSDPLGAMEKRKAKAIRERFVALRQWSLPGLRVTLFTARKPA
ncbi:glycosyltransferase family 39 protein [Rhizomonospora bruguierae]|uniref:glycosyltransferase family 39 protein n=1 Tax=Rhizomonospora bruguierae TaxID=1581705 RepID=UPI001BD069A0|nr:glycosyltransferase family 39 protein [Micromonospora sp. NBRC 107566]